MVVSRGILKCQSSREAPTWRAAPNPGFPEPQRRENLDHCHRTAWSRADAQPSSRSRDSIGHRGRWSRCVDDPLRVQARAFTTDGELGQPEEAPWGSVRYRGAAGRRHEAQASWDLRLNLSLQRQSQPGSGYWDDRSRCPSRRRKPARRRVPVTGARRACPWRPRLPCRRGRRRSRQVGRCDR